MAEEKFKLPQSSYDELAKIVKGYGHSSKPASLDDIKQVTGLHTTIISRNAGFLIAVGILMPGAKKTITLEGKDLALALEHGIPDRIIASWRKIVTGNDFLTKLLIAIKIRSGMDEDTLETHIAYSAGQPKKQQFMTGARTIIDILRAAQLINDQDGKIITTELIEKPSVEKNIVDKGIPTEEQIVSEKTIMPVVKSKAVPEINIQININCTPENIEGLGSKLKLILKEFEPNSSDANEGA